MYWTLREVAEAQGDAAIGRKLEGSHVEQCISPTRLC